MPRPGRRALFFCIDRFDIRRAARRRAVQLADQSGHAGTAELLGRLVDVIDAGAGAVRLNKAVAGIDAELANVRSVKTIRVKNRR